MSGFGQHCPYAYTMRDPMNDKRAILGRIQQVTMRTLFRLHPLLAALTLWLTSGFPAHAQEVHAAPGQFDYYVLNLSWSPEFCHNVEVLPQSERAERRQRDTSVECGTPHGFVLHGLWPQNFNGTWPANCSSEAGPASYTPYLKDTPSLMLLRHEWAKHGTCSTLRPDAFFTKADHAFEAVKVPTQLQAVSQTLQLQTADVLRGLYAANPSYPQGSIVLSCGRNYLTAVEVCLSKDGLQPIACQNLHSCAATVIKVAPEGVQQP